MLEWNFCDYRTTKVIHGCIHVAKFGTAMVKQKPMLGSACEHSIGFGSPFSDEVINKNANISNISSNIECFLAFVHLSAALAPAIEPCAAASSYPEVPLI